MILTVQEIAQRLGTAAVEGDASAKIAGLSGIREAQPGEIAFVANPRYAAAAATTRASAVIVNAEWKHPCPAALIRVKNPDKAFADVAAWYAPPAVEPEPGIHATAVIAANVKLGAGVRIGPYCVLEPGVDVGDNAIISAQCYLGHGVAIGADSKLYPQVSIREHCRLGRRCIVHNGTVIGSDGFGYVQEGEVRKKIPQIGIVVIGDDVEIGANVAIDRARFGQTRIGNGVKIDNLVQIAHNVVIGDNAVIVAQVGISGSTLIGDRTIIAGQAGLTGHLVVGPDVIVGAQSGVHRDVPKGSYVLGTPAEPHERARKIMVLMGRLPEMREKLAALEERLAKLEAAAKPKG